MKKNIFTAFALFLGLGSAIIFTNLTPSFSTLAYAEPNEAPQAAIVVDPATTARIVNIKMETSMGDVLLELYPNKAPETVKNFLSYTNAGYYDGTIFHRVIKGFMNQGGGFTTDYVKKETQKTIPNEAFNGLKNQRGTIAMARTGAPHSATSQFFINTKDNVMLNHTGKNSRGWGYAVFGKITSGLDVMDTIANAPTGAVKHFSQDAPKKQVVILKMSELKSETVSDKPETSTTK